MTKYEQLPYVEVSFVVDGKDLEPEKLTEELGILPTETRGLDDWPEAIKKISIFCRNCNPDANGV